MTKVAFSPDGNLLVSAGLDGTILLWSRNNRGSVDQILGDHSATSSAVLSPDGKWLAYGSVNNAVIVQEIGSAYTTYDSLHGKRYLRGTTDTVTSLAFSPDGKLLVTGSIDHTVTLWDIAAGKQVDEPLRGHTGQISAVAFSPDGKFIASASYDQTIRIWDASSRQLVGSPLTGHSGPVLSIAYSPDGKRLLSGSWDKTFILWDVAQQHMVGQPIQASESRVTAVAYSPDGKQFATGSAVGAIRLWDAQSLQPVGAPYKGHTNAINGLAFDPKGSRFSSASADGTLIEWDIASRKGIQNLNLDLGYQFYGVQAALTSYQEQRASGPVTGVAYSADGTTAVWSFGGTAADRGGGFYVRGIEAPIYDVPLTAVSPMEVLDPALGMIATSTNANRIVVWDLASRQPVADLDNVPSGVKVDSSTVGRGGLSVVYDLADRVTPDGVIVDCDYSNGTVTSLNLVTQQRISYQKLPPDCNTLRAGRGYVLAATRGGASEWDMLTGNAVSLPPISNPILLAVSPDGHTALYSQMTYSQGEFSNLEGLYLWDMKAGRQLGDALGFSNSWYQGAFVFSPDSKRLAVLYAPDTLVLLDIATGKPVGHSIRAAVGELFSPDGHWLAVQAPESNSVTVYNAETGQQVGSPVVSYGAMAFSPDSKLLATSTADKSIVRWSVADGQTVGLPLTGHANRVNHIVFSPDGNYMASGAEDNKILFWSIAEARSLREIVGDPQSAFFSPNSEALYWIGASNEARFADSPLLSWDIRADAWQARACQGVNRNFTRQEWDRYVGATIAYEKLCPDLPIPIAVSIPTSTLNVILLTPRPSATIIPTEAPVVEPTETGTPATPTLTPVGLNLSMANDNFVARVAFSAQSDAVAIGQQDGKVLMLGKSGASWQATRTLEGHQGAVYAVAFSPDGSLLATGGTDRTIRLWDAHTGKEIRRIASSTEHIYSLVFSPDGKLLAAGGTEDLVRLWDVGSGTLVRTLLGAKDILTQLTFTPDGRYILGDAMDVLIWDAQSGNIKQRYDFAQIGDVLLFSPGGKYLLDASHIHPADQLLPWTVRDALTGQALNYAKPSEVLENGSLQNFIFTADERSALLEVDTGVGTGFYFMSLDNGQIVKILPDQTVYQTHNIKLSPDDQWLFLSDGTTFSIWSLGQAMQPYVPSITPTVTDTPTITPTATPRVSAPRCESALFDANPDARLLSQCFRQGVEKLQRTFNATPTP